MLSRWYAGLSKTNTVLVALIAILVLLSLIKSGYYTLHYGGSDLRNRVVGARLLDAHRSPYFYRWSPGDPEQIADPNDDHTRVVNGVTLAPGTLYFQSLFNTLHYPLIRILWTVFTYFLGCCIFGSVLAARNNSSKATTQIIAIGGLLFLCTPLWFLNIERGQVYILFAFFFSGIYYLCQQQKTGAFFLAGLLIAIAVYCRPNMIVVIIPFLLTRHWKVLAGFGIMAIPLALHAYYHTDIWKDYTMAMFAYSTNTSTDSLQAPYNLAHYPSVIEGAHNLTLYKTDFTVGGITSLKYWISHFAFSNNNWIYPGLYALILLLFTGLFRKHLNRQDSAGIILFCFLLYVFSEYLIPTARNPYTLIEWLFPVLLILKKEYLSDKQTLLLITGLCLINSLPFYLPYLDAIGEWLLVYCLFISLSPRISNFFTFTPWVRKS